VIEHPTIVVLRQKPHGLPATDLVEALRERLSTGEVRHAATLDGELSLAAEADVLVGGSLQQDVLSAAADLSLFACSYAGYEHLPLEALQDRSIAVTNAGGVHAPNAAEHAIGSLLAMVRDLPGFRRQQREREWRNVPTGELAGGTVLVVGMGAIGTAICRRLDGFDVEVVGVRHSPEKAGPADQIVGYDEFHSALPDADAVILACPLTDRTRYLLDREAFRTLPPNAIVVNVARGRVVDTEDLVDSLRANHLGGVALDVTDPEPLPEDHPLWTFENVLLTPHNAGYTPKYYERLADIVAENVERAVESGEWDDLRNQIV